MKYAVVTIHMQGFARMIKPEKFEPQDVVHATLGLGSSSVRKLGQSMVEQGFAIIDKQLAGKSFAGGEHFSIADAALFYVERWAPQCGIALPANVAAHFERIKARPAVQRVMTAEGETP